MIPIIVYLVLFTAAFWIFAAVSVLTLLALHEYNNLTILKIRDRWSDRLGMALGLVVPLLLYFRGAGYLPAFLTGAVFIFFFYNMAVTKDLRDASYDTAFKTLGLLYVAVTLSYAIALRQLDGGQWWIMLLLVIIWSNDTFAYLTGKTVGKTRLCPEISPKKTVEGAVGGLVGGFIAAYLFNRFLSMGLGVCEVVFFSTVIGAVGIIGDLAESLLKRAAGVKDSGTLIPGHGGVLDRIDSLLFALPVFYYSLIWYFKA
ncbi:MAG: phosphatidate cytidylyltransferase [Deltaproteobacteria bacterium]|nr:phosphatidate cytidylyltransferase [Deltaproteobacteria bacterium]